MSTAAIANDRMKDSSLAARPPANDASHAAGPLNIWPYLASAAGMLAATSAQISVSFWPTSGSSASRGGGGGIDRLWFCTAETSENIEDPSDVTTMTIGTSSKTMLTSPISSADQRLPIRTARRRCSGFSITARIIDQSRMPVKGSMIRLQA